ncbi:conserved hypothetical protein [Pyrenophora tritici-repentis Pt-1C-BFP]|uniref:Uncharacterized protein n=1 Tax=Pyrenophora tritici-repentis (strain Pt-1C-BFP) TaxID=426418 RepID=B2VU21_PYRTR|nr:uncharacterized protein PTRG_00945 [Pyrenophora tritici-repentis Pt-1C-BFP]EDU40383.1 conserved hypothetical protein [Pyrenophora tritici-repentis Pt-1C-BFP]
MEHYAPHPSSQFEGWYSKFDLASGAHIALIICSVPKATSRPHMVSFTYYPASGDSIFQREHFVDTSSTHTTWRQDKSTPEGWFINLPLPLHWHVHSLCSPATFTLNIPALGDAFPAVDRQNRATIHQEKNWANSFPDAHMWVQAWDNKEKRGISLAGGKIMYNTAYLVGYRSPALDLDFIPPFSISYLNLASPFMNVANDWESRSFSISVSNYSYKLELKAHAPKEHGWFGLAAPFPNGHRANFAIESFIAMIEVRISERDGWWPWSAWKEVKTERWEGASLEFAGGYYPERGENKDE